MEHDFLGKYVAYNIIMSRGGFGMSSHISALGYIGMDDKKEYGKLLAWAINEVEQWQGLQVSLTNDVFWQGKAVVNEDVGFMVYGMNDFQNDPGGILGMTPWGRARYPFILQEIDFDVKDQGEFEIFAEGWKKNYGKWITFYVQNVLEYYEWLAKNDTKTELTCYLAGLCYIGEIIAPYNYHMEEVAVVDTQEYVLQRGEKKRLFDQVLGYFIQKQSTVEDVVFMGEILELKLLDNPETEEEFYWMYVKMADELQVEVYINTSDLEGIPAVGRRLKGACWLQGNVQFD